MSFVTHYRGHMQDYSGEFDESMLVQEISLDEYLEFQYPPVLLEQFTRQAQAGRQIERTEILSASMPGDTLWLWRCVDWSQAVDGAPFDRGGLSVRRAGKVVQVWLVWEGY